MLIGFPRIEETVYVFDYKTYNLQQVYAFSVLL